MTNNHPILAQHTRAVFISPSSSCTSTHQNVLTTLSDLIREAFFLRSMYSCHTPSSRYTVSLTHALRPICTSADEHSEHNVMRETIPNKAHVKYMFFHRDEFLPGRSAQMVHARPLYASTYQFSPAFLPHPPTLPHIITSFGPRTSSAYM